MFYDSGGATWVSAYKLREYKGYTDYLKTADSIERTLDNGVVFTYTGLSDYNVPID